MNSANIHSRYKNKIGAPEYIVIYIYIMHLHYNPNILLGGLLTHKPYNHI